MSGGGSKAMRAAVVLGAALGAVGGPARTALADRTPLLKVDLKTGRKTRIDKRGPRTAADRELDALVTSVAGKRFSTADLERIERAVRRYLRKRRSRAQPRLLLFLYPGRITKARLKRLREVMIDIDLVVDPCSRSVCRDSVAKSLEILGRSLKQATIRTKTYLIRFKSVTVRTSTSIGGKRYDIYTFRADDVVRAGKSRSGRRLVARLVGARSNYPRKMSRAIARALKARRVPLVKTPRVRRATRSATVAIEIRSDRVRYRRQVTSALAGAVKVLRSSSLTPSAVALTVVARVRMRRVQRRTFRCAGHAVGLYLDGRISSSALWSNYVIAERKKGTKLSFSDADTRGRGRGRAREPDRTAEILAANVSRLAPCLQREARRNRRFKGATLVFAVNGKGVATGIKLRERASARLKRCLARALKRIRFQRHGGAPRRVSYPLFIRR